MKRSTRWMIALAATAWLAVPVAMSAQQTSPEPQQTPTQQTPTQQPTPTEPTPPTPTEPGQPTPTVPPTRADQPPTQEPPVDADEAKRHLTAARDALSQLTQLPAASQLTGDARTQVSQLITNFNELITTNVEWRASYAKVESNLSALIGNQRADESPATPATGTPGAVGTSGTIALDQTIRATLEEFRSHLLEFEKAAGGGASQSAANTPSPTPTTSSAPPATTPGNTAAPGSTSTPPSSVTSSASSAADSSAAPPETAGTTGTASTTSSTPTESSPVGTSGTTATSVPEPQTRPGPTRTQTAAPTESKEAGHSEALRHIDAIETILKGRSPDKPAGTSGTSTGERSTSLDRDQIEQIRAHLGELRRLMEQSGK